MCGIVGEVCRRGYGDLASPDQRALAMKSISHRGPDAQGQYMDAQVWFGHARLSIIDLSSAANQPMGTADERHAICYNGEVYNFAELAKSLALDNLRSASDTEVVLRAFVQRGVASFPLLNGLFAFGIHDKSAEKVYVVRDRLGIKPLYYRMGEGGFAFASEIKALLALDDRATQCNRSALHEWVYYGTTLGESTLYRGIQKLLPGRYLELDLATFTLKQDAYWSPAQFAGGPKNTNSTEQIIAKTRELLEQAVARQLVSDVPVGVFLSGGVDSSAITAFASRHYAGKLATFSAGFDFDKGANELPKAREIAALYGTEHHEVRISGLEIGDIVEKMVAHHDQPFSDAANIPLYLLANQIKDTTKVVLQGDGGDELFGGYGRYSTLRWLRGARALAPVVGLLNQLTARGSGYYRRQRYVNALKGGTTAEVMALLLTEEGAHSHPERIFDARLRAEIVRSDPFKRYRECQGLFTDEDTVNQMLFVDAMIILPDIFLEKVDRSTMAAAVEVRVPFLDNELVDFCFRLSGDQKVRRGRKKWLLKKALEGVVPNDVLYGRKTGFSVPNGYWLRGALKPLFFDHLAAFTRRYPGILDDAVIRALHAEHTTGRRDRSFLLWKVLMFTIWANRAPHDFAF